VHVGTKFSIYFLNLRNKTNFLIPDMTHFESRLFRPQSADRKTSFALQLAEKHFTALVILQKSVLLGLKIYFWPLIFISYQLTVVNGQVITKE
jgi:hypothetical protein